MEKLFNKFLVSEPIILENDGYIGIPVKISVFFDSNRYKAEPGYRKTPIIIYVINTNTDRIGKDTDESIISRMLNSGYIVTVLDYMNSPLSSCPGLDFSVQKIRQRIINGEFFTNHNIFPIGKYSETLVVPAGYDVLYNKPYWAFDLHGGDGDFEKIVEVWNNDFRGTNPDRIIKWTDTNGKRKSTQEGHDGSSPEWLDFDGNSDKNGEYIRIKYTKAETITDCVKPDGSPIELNLFMHIIYPTNPDLPAPVMSLANSSEDLCLGSATADRPHLLGFLFRGYAGVMYDYGYTPMARLDCYGYFDGYPKKGYVTGDNATYSMAFYNDKRINTAAMRFIRYTALSNKNVSLDLNSIGVYGNSKGGWMTFLGEKDPEKMQSKRMHHGHHDETRYENGKTADEGIIRGGTEQPWLTYKGERILGEANFVYSSCGGVDDAVTEGHCPMFISCNRRDGSCYSTSNALVNTSRIYNVPALCVDIPLGHTITRDNDLLYGFDTYVAFFDFIGYYFKCDAPRVLGARMNYSHFPADITVKFSGGIDLSEAHKIKVIDNYGDVVDGEWKAIFGGVEWIFTPYVAEYGKEYKLTIPDTVIGKNGKAIKDGFTSEFKTADASVTEVAINSSANGLHIAFTKVFDADEHYITLINEVGANTIGVYTVEGQRIALANVADKGAYKIDVTDYVSKLHCGALCELILKSEYAPGNEVISFEDFTEENCCIKPSEKSVCSLDKAPDGTPAFKFGSFKTITEFPTEEFYSYPARIFEYDSIIKNEAISHLDMGRKFNISLKVYDTVSRYIRVELSHCTSREDSVADYKRNCYNIRTEADKWIEVSFDYTVYEPMYKHIKPQNKKLIVSAYGHGNDDKPMYFTDLKATELLSDLEISEINLISMAKTDVLPDGQSAIFCEKSPWSKK